ncbi:MAG: hypothetical protein AAGD25_06455 [Cyanobacteria bacterium P01_F01_bin.150]
MYAFDRDGTVIGSVFDYAANNPNNLASPADMKIIKPVADWINKNGGIIISNQDGPTRRKGVGLVMKEFEYLMKSITGLQGCYWSVSKNGVDGAECHGFARESGIIVHVMTLDASHYGGSFRKPSPGMALLAKANGFEITHYVGDLSGIPNYANGKDSDRVFAQNAGLRYVDVRGFDVY